jgi:hypothetical protein
MAFLEFPQDAALRKSHGETDFRATGASHVEAMDFPWIKTSRRNFPRMASHENYHEYRRVSLWMAFLEFPQDAALQKSHGETDFPATVASLAEAIDFP